MNGRRLELVLASSSPPEPPPPLYGIDLLRAVVEDLERKKLVRERRHVRLVTDDDAA